VYVCAHKLARHCMHACAHMRLDCVSSGCAKLCFVGCSDILCMHRQGGSDKSLISLPLEMLEEILGKLSLFEGARMAATCRTLHALYRPLMAREQKARYDLAVKSCGRERIACILALIKLLLTGRRLRPWDGKLAHGRWNDCWVCADGVLRGPTRLNPHSRERGEDILASICPGQDWRDSPHVYEIILFGPPSWQGAGVSFRVDRNRVGTLIDAVTTGDGNLHMVALLQALLSDGLAQSIHDAGQHVEIRLRPVRIHSESEITREGLRAQIAPLLPFVSQYTPVRKASGNPGFAEPAESMHIGHS
jgi:hypothetical protein